MAGPQRELWKDKESGGLWVVELLRGRVLGCHGLLAAEDVAGLSLAEVPFERDPNVLRTLRARRDQFLRQVLGPEAP
jgi:hypothetical protein